MTGFCTWLIVVEVPNGYLFMEHVVVYLGLFETIFIGTCKVVFIVAVLRKPHDTCCDLFLEFCESI